MTSSTVTRRDHLPAGARATTAGDGTTAPIARPQAVGAVKDFRQEEDKSSKTERTISAHLLVHSVSRPRVVGAAG